MQYYIEISSWNLLESFVTESISPFSFYNERDFGNNLSRYLSGNKEKVYYLILSSKDLGGEASLLIDDNLLDSSCLKPVKRLKTVFTYPKTIYYKKGYVKFRFRTEELKNSLIAESRILLEVKCLEKYLSDFYVKDSKSINWKGLSTLSDSISFEKYNYIGYDNRYNKIKGAIVGYIRGSYTTSDETNMQLQNNLRNLKNAFGGLNTQIMMGGYPDELEIKEQLNECKRSYLTYFNDNSSFDVIIAQYNEIVKLSKLRKEDASHWRKKELLALRDEKEREITILEQEYNIHDLQRELNQIRNEERRNGELVGKTIQYYKKGTRQKERKDYLKQLLSDFENNKAYYTLNKELDAINQELDTNKYDSTIAAIFTRISDLLNELIKVASNVTSRGNINISDIMITEESVHIMGDACDSEKCYFNLLLNHILNNSNNRLSEYNILQFIEQTAKNFKGHHLADTPDGVKILDTLRVFWAYKNQKTDKFSIPEDMPILQSIMSFFVKPLGFEQIERFMLMKNYTQKRYAFMLWGALVGFADLPKTFTNILYQNDEIPYLIENAMEFTSFSYK